MLVWLCASAASVCLGNPAMSCLSNSAAEKKHGKVRKLTTPEGAFPPSSINAPIVIFP
ncbi:hypothetical protein HY486_01570 [Candidatus Woesearchaeota archaeon]|nr:hypothetical protein [Candidatus Woesearchaeota archaeon]